MTDMWLNKYEKESFEKDIEEIMQQFMPLYKQIHAYVRRKLRNVSNI